MSIKMRKLILLFSCFFFTVAAAAVGQVPSASDVYSSVKDKWVARDFQSLDTYITDLYAAFPMYVRSLLAASFHDVVFKGELLNGKVKLEAIAADAHAKPGEYADDFVQELKFLIRIIEQEIDMHDRHGTSAAELQNNASPSEVRNIWGEDSFPSLKILEWEVNATLSSP